MFYHTCIVYSLIASSPDPYIEKIRAWGQGYSLRLGYIHTHKPVGILLPGLCIEEFDIIFSFNFHVHIAALHVHIP